MTSGEAARRVGLSAVVASSCRAWFFAVLALVPCGLAHAAPTFTPSCDRAMPKEQVDELIDIVRGSVGACRLIRVDTQLFRTRIEWEGQGRGFEVLLAPRGCLIEPSREGASLSMHAPAELAAACPQAFGALSSFVGDAREVTPLASAEDGIGPTGDAVGEPRVVALLVALGAVVLALAWMVRALGASPKTQPQPDGEVRAWRWLMVGGFGVALLARGWVEPTVGNWYGAFLPAEGWGDQRFGVFASVVQAGVRAVLPWNTEVAFGLFRVVGALAVPLTMMLVRRFGGSSGAGALAGLIVALEPIPVRLSASSSEHAIAASLAVAAWVCWQIGASEARWAPRLLAVGCAWLAVLTRADCLPQLLLLPVFTVVGQPLGESAPWLPIKRRLVDAAGFTVALAAIGMHAWVSIVVPSNHPRPEPEAILRTARVLLTQFWVVASEPPHWLTWPCLFIAAMGCIALVLLRRARLLAAVALALVLIFVPLGRNLTHDGLTGARYFVLLMPVLGLLAAALVRLVCVSLPAMRRPAQASAALLGFGALELWAAQSGWRHEYTFQAEYRFLASALGTQLTVSDGCTLWFVRPRQPVTGDLDLDCCLWPANSPLTLLAPRIRFRPIPADHEPGDADGCHLYYEGSVCSLEARDEATARVPRLLRQCEVLRGRPGETLQALQVTDQTLNERFRNRPWVRLRARGLK